MIEFIKYILLGLLQGIAEVLPISSSGHLAIAGAIFSLQDDNLAFEVFLHLASLIAVLAFLIKPIIKLVKGCFLYVFKKNKDYAFEFKYLLFLIISTIPIVVFTIIMKFDLKVAALSRPSRASPPLKEPSPISAITLPFSPFKSRAFATPQARLTEVEVCPTLNKSWSHSSGAV